MRFDALLRLVVLFAALAPVVAGIAFAQVDGLAGDVAYVNRFGQLAVIDAAGGEPRLLSPIGTAYQFPAFAPDGGRIAAVGVADGAGSIGVFDGEAIVEAYRSEAQPPIYLFWSPDGRTLSFIASRAATGLGFWMAQADSEPRLVATGNPFYWSWDPASEALLAHVSLTGPGSRLAFVTADAGIAPENLDAPGWFQSPDISSDGTYLAYATVAPGGARRVVVATHPDVQGERVRRELDHSGFAMFAWSPTDAVLAVMSPTQPAPHWFGPIDLLDAEDGLLEPLVDDVALAFFWSPDGSKLAFITPAPASDVQRVVVVGDRGLAGAVPSPRGVTDGWMPGGWLAPAGLGGGTSAEALGPPWGETGRRQNTPARGAGDRQLQSRAGGPGEVAGGGRADARLAQEDAFPLQQGAVRLELGVVDMAAPQGERVRMLGTFTPSLAFVDQFLPFFDQYAKSHRIWSPASDAIVLPAVGIDGVTRVTVFGLDGSQRPLAQGDMPFWNVE